MLIHVDGSAIDDALVTAKSRECIENLLMAHQAAKHVVSIDPEHVDALTPISPDLSLRARGALRSIRSQGTEIRGLRGRMRWSMKLGLGPAFSGRAVTESGKQVILASLHDFHDQERVGRTVLLGENLTDAAFYLTMADAFLAELGWRAKIVAFAKQQGGGSTTAPAFAELVRDGRIVLAIVDSDRKHPGDDVGGTAAKLLPVARNDFQHVHVLHVRFAENLLSSAIYREAFAAARSGKLSALTGLMQAETLSSTVPWRDHAELKHGLKLFDVRATTAGSDLATFWARAAIDLGRDQCREAQPCRTATDCRCYVVEALGKDALDLAVAWLSPRDAKRNAKLLGLSTNTQLRDLCEKLLAWGIALAARQA